MLYFSSTHLNLQCVAKMFTVYSLYVHYIFNIGSLYAHYTALYINYIFTINSLYVNYIFVPDQLELWPMLELVSIRAGPRRNYPLNIKCTLKESPNYIELTIFVISRMRKHFRFFMFCKAVN